MPTFSDRDLAEIQSFIDTQLNRLAAIGLSLEPESDMTAFSAFLSTAPDAHLVPSTHDPERSHVHPGNAYWTVLRNQHGEIVGCNGQRMYETDDLFEDIRTHAFFKDRLPVIRHYPLPLYPDLDFLQFPGESVLAVVCGFLPIGAVGMPRFLAERSMAYTRRSSGQSRCATLN